MKILDEKKFKIWKGKLLTNKERLYVRGKQIENKYLFHYYNYYYKIRVEVTSIQGELTIEIKNVRHDSFVGNQITEDIEKGLVDEHGNIALPIHGRLVKLPFPNEGRYFIKSNLGEKCDNGLWRFIFEGEYNSIVDTIDKFHNYSIPHLIKIGQLRKDS